MMALSSYASEPISSDTLSSEKVDTAQQVKKSWMTRFLDYFNDANKNKQHKRFDFSVIGGPHYASDTKFGLGMVAAGLYRTDPNDSILPPSNVSLFGDVSSVGFYMLGVRGNPVVTALIIISISIPSLPISGESVTRWAITMTTRVI